MVEAAERLYGPYRWGRYDVIVLPPSFPYGGMENPTLTFLTPTFIAGDRSLVGLVAHELAHSWSGNLVTNATWPDFWLNEGFTSYFENRIMEALYGRARAAQEAALSWDDMQSALRRARRERAAHRGSTTRRDDPDGGSSGIVYDKGAIFLRTIERIVGRERFDAWLRSYFDRHAFQPMTSARFLADLRANLVRGDAALEAEAAARRLGLPARPARQCRAARSGRLRRGRRGGRARSTPAAPPARCPMPAGTTAERLRFLNGLPRAAAAARLAELDRGLRPVGKRQCRGAVRLAAARRSPTATSRRCRRPSASCSAMGRRKFVAPLVRDAGRRGRLGPADRRAHLCPRPARLSQRDDGGGRPPAAAAKARKARFVR